MVLLLTVMPNFAQRVEVAVDALSSNPAKDVDENEFIDASRLVYDGVREIRRAVLMNRVSIYKHVLEFVVLVRVLINCRSIIYRLISIGIEK
jgi:hypothetical protein